MSRDLLRNVPVPELVEIYQNGVKQLKSEVSQIKATIAMIEQAFGSSYKITYSEYEIDAFQSTMLIAMKRMAWKRLIDVSHVRQILSIRKMEELDRQLGRGISTMPDITLENIYSTFLEFTRNSDEFLRETAVEVFDILTPGRRIAMREHKTNMKYPFAIQEKIILKNHCRYMSRRQADDSVKMIYEVNSYYSGTYVDNIVAIDKMFHLLDGKVLPETGSPLLNAINTTGENPIGETEYFKFKCFKGNKSWDSGGNLHLWIKRMDLAARLAQYASQGDKLQGDLERS